MSKIISILSLGDKSVFDISVDKQKAYLKKLGEPCNLIDRSYKQYLCQNLYKCKLKIYLLNFLFAFLFPIAIIYLFLISKKNKIIHVDAIGNFGGMEEILPDELVKKYEIHNELWWLGSYLSLADISYVLRVMFHFPFSFYFSTKVLLFISKYSYMIKCYTPDAIIVHSEYSFVSSILTDYCNTRGVYHINVMHGEKLFFIRDSYFCFNQCYVWDSFYENLFISLNAEPSQFIIAIPPSMKINCVEYIDSNCFADYKYYLARCSEVQLKSIIASMQFAVKNGKKVVYRLHPRYTDAVMVEKYVNKKFIEYPNKVSIQKSIANAGCIVGSYTTVLNQAYNIGKNILFDDVTFSQQYLKLKELHYFFSEKDCELLSRMQ